MSWALFCQIEVIILTCGLVASFVISARQNSKDNSFFKRVGGIAKALEELSKKLTETVAMKRGNGNDEGRNV